MNSAYLILAISAFSSATYINIVTFFIIHRMKKHTPWALAAWVMSVAALGCYTWLRTLSFMVCESGDVPIWSSAITIICGLSLAIMPRINVEPWRRNHVEKVML